MRTGAALGERRRIKTNMESIGQTLREARHTKMASLEDASRATKIKVDILEKLESDEFDQLAAPMYTKGFLRMYAVYLGLDGQTVVDSYLHSQGGLRRQGLQVETEATIRARKPPELHLAISGVIRVVAAVTLAVILGLASGASGRATPRRGRGQINPPRNRNPLCLLPRRHNRRLPCRKRILMHIISPKPGPRLSC